MTGTKIPLSVTPNNIASLSIGETLSEVGKECKSTSKNNIKSKTGRNGSKKGRKSLLQEQQEVLQKNGKTATETKLRDKNEDSVGNVNVVSEQPLTRSPHNLKVHGSRPTSEKGEAEVKNGSIKVFVSLPF